MFPTSRTTKYYKEFNTRNREEKKHFVGWKDLHIELPHQRDTQAFHQYDAVLANFLKQ